jgi:hypothetical protein
MNQSHVTGLDPALERFHRATRSCSSPTSSRSRPPRVLPPRNSFSVHLGDLRVDARHRGLRKRETWRIALLAVTLMVLLGPTGGPMVQKGITLNLDWDICSSAQWTATGHGALEESNDPGRHSVLTSQIRRANEGCANRFEIKDSFLDMKSGFRALWAKYDSNEGTTGGTDFVYGLSFQANAVPRYAHIWELHQRANIYRIDPDLSVAPHALIIRDGALQYREMTGAARWNGDEWTGWSNDQDQQVLLASLLPNTWYDVMIRIKASEQANGLTQVYVRQAGQSWPASPSWQNSGPSLPYVPGGLDPRIPDKIGVYQAEPDTDGLTGLFLAAGIYTGSSTWIDPVSPVIVYLDQLRRYTDLASAKAGFPSR